MNALYGLMREKVIEFFFQFSTRYTIDLIFSFRKK